MDLELEIYRSYLFDIATRTLQIKLMYKIETAKSLNDLKPLAFDLGRLLILRGQPVPDEPCYYRCYQCFGFVGYNQWFHIISHPSACTMHPFWMLLYQFQEGESKEGDDVNPSVNI